MKKTFFLVSVLFMNACAASRPPVPIGTVPLPLEPTQAEEQQGHQVLSGLTKKYKLDYNHPRYQEVQDVMKRLTDAAGASAHPWHIYLLKDDTFKNAGATKGNHIFLWTPMLDYTQNKDELAGVLAHEVAHVLARHTDGDPNEGMKKVLIGIGATAASIAVGQLGLGVGGLGQMTGQITAKVGEGIFVNPHSQRDELEADHVGLFLMAKAKYNPEAAVTFWQRAANDRSFGSGPSFFSTHPSSSKRLTSLKEILPDAMLYYTGTRPLDSSATGSYLPTRRDSTPASTAPNSSDTDTADDTWDIRN